MSQGINSLAVNNAAMLPIPYTLLSIKIHATKHLVTFPMSQGINSLAVNSAAMLPIPYTLLSIFILIYNHKI